MQIKITELAKFVAGTVDGDENVIITGIAKIDEAEPGTISFISNPRYAKFMETTKASAILVNRDFPQTDRTVVRTDNPYVAFLKLLIFFYPPVVTLEPGIHPTAVIDSSAQVSKFVSIGANVVIGKRCRIGDFVHLHPNVVLSDDVEIGDYTILYPNSSVREQVRIGKNVIIHNGTVVGSDGFGFAREGEIYHKIPQVGIVVIEDHVEIGANCTIDRATLGETRIEQGVKLDNLVQVAHNVIIGRNTVVAAQSGISGSTKIGKNVVVGGQVGFAGHITVGDQVTIGAQSGVSKSLDENAVYFGYPARPIMQAKREEAALRKLPELLKRIYNLEKELNELRAGKKC